MSELLGYISEGEGLHQDFKFRIDDQAKIARTLVAFANSSGGRLLIGVKDNGKIVGCDPQEEFYMIEGAAEMFCQPSLDIRSHIWQEKHHYVLEVKVEKSEKRHKAKDEEGKWRAYYRIDDHSLKGNSVLDQLWKLERSDKRKPKKFSDEEIGVIRLIRENQPISISSLNKLTQLGFGPLTDLLASLVHWKVIDLQVSQKGMRYIVAEED
jgi:predicted HTH transcriptional regulator